jgi:formate dehydrogenase (NADP+) alpha subunit
VAGLAIALGSGAMTNSIAEIGSAGCIIADGTSTTEAHPIIGYQVKKAVRNGTKLIVINPQEVPLTQFADLHLPLRPGSDVVLLMGMARAIIEAGLHDQKYIEERCENFDKFKESLAAYTPEFVSDMTGLDWELVDKAARMYAENGPGSILYCMGITQHSHGTDNVLAISNLALITGNLGNVSGGVNPLRGQNNVQGACDVGSLPNVFTGYQKVDNDEARKKFEEAWGANLSAKPGLTHTEIFDAAYKGEIKALYLVGENPVLTEANASHAIEAMDKLEFFVVQDIFLNETAKKADVVLPAASFAEKNGTFVNTERRVQRVRKVIEPIGEAKPDWWITSAIANEMGAEGFAYNSAAEIFKELASLTPSYAGISYERLDAEYSIQWPCPTADHPGTPILHREKFATPSGKAKLMPLEFRPSEDCCDFDFPLILTTERSLFQFHSTMTRYSEGLDELSGGEQILINPADAAKLGIADGDMVEVKSRRGKLKVKATLTRRCQPGVASLSFHFAECPTNLLTSAALDPVAKTPETKVCAIRIDKV